MLTRWCARWARRHARWSGSRATSGRASRTRRPAPPAWVDAVANSTTVSSCATVGSRSPPTRRLTPRASCGAQHKRRSCRCPSNAPRWLSSSSSRTSNGARRRATRSSRCSRPDAVPSPCSRPSTTSGSSCGCCPSGSTCGLARSGTRTTGSRSTGTRSKRSRSVRLSSTSTIRSVQGSTATWRATRVPTCCCSPRCSTTSRRVDRAITPSSASRPHATSRRGSASTMPVRRCSPGRSATTCSSPTPPPGAIWVTIAPSLGSRRRWAIPSATPCCTR